MKKIVWPLLLMLITLAFFYKFFFYGLLPIPADTIVGMYHPFRDLYAKQYPNGIPFKNFLITDPVRQQFVWRELAIDLLKKGEVPLWNPYSFSGTPLLANFQSASFYPLNILFFVLPFKITWSLLIILQPFLAGLFLFLYLRQIKLCKLAAFWGGLTFAFSGFAIAWLEWNTILHVVLWLPLILLAIEKIAYHLQDNKKLIMWSFILIFSLVSSFFAGHLQFWFYLFLTTLGYSLTFLYRNAKRKKLGLILIICWFLFTFLTSLQWLPTAKFILNSGRAFDQINWQQEGWFIPWPHLIQFFAPDFFGNPSTLNYWGVWNYGEFIGYIGVAPLIFAFLAIFFRRDKKTLFFIFLAVFALILATSNPIAKLPFRFSLPFVSTSQPTRLIFIIDVALAVLSALGFDFWLKQKVRRRELFKILIPLGLIYICLWLFSQFGQKIFTGVSMENLQVARRNLILPAALFILVSFIISLPGCLFNEKKNFFKFNQHLSQLVMGGLIIALIFDLFRFGWKFTPFTKSEYLFPSTKTVEFLQKQKQPFRLMVTDKRILPPNFSVSYRLQEVAGYDPLFLKNYGELVSAWIRDKADLSTFSFNRIVTPQDYESRIADLLNVKYLLSLDNLYSKNLSKVFEEGQTKIYENKNASPRAFWAESTIEVENKQEAIEKIFNKSVDLKKQAIVYEDLKIKEKSLSLNEEVKITGYFENEIRLKVNADIDRLLVLADNYSSDWEVFVDGEKEKLYQVDYNLRGVLVKKGEHKVKFKIKWI